MNFIHEVVQTADDKIAAVGSTAKQYSPQMVVCSFFIGGELVFKHGKSFAFVATWLALLLADGSNGRADAMTLQELRWQRNIKVGDLIRQAAARTIVDEKYRRIESPALVANANSEAANSIGQLQAIVLLERSLEDLVNAEPRSISALVASSDAAVRASLMANNESERIKTAILIQTKSDLSLPAASLPERASQARMAAIMKENTPVRLAKAVDNVAEMVREPVVLKVIASKKQAVTTGPSAKSAAENWPNLSNAQIAAEVLAALKSDTAELHNTVNETLEIVVDQHGVEFRPQSLAFARVGDSATVKVRGDHPDANKDKLNLFVRDPSMVEWSSSLSQLTARKLGTTEMYVVSNNRMYILPLQIDEDSKPTLSVPGELVSLNGLRKSSLEAAYPTAEFALPKATQLNVNALSLADSKAQTKEALDSRNLTNLSFSPAARRVGYTTVALQVVDERSAPSAGKVVAVDKVVVQLAGTEFEALTDTLGHVVIKDMPQTSRFLVRISDPEGRIIPTVAELPTSAATDSGVIHLRSMRFFTLENLTRMAGVVQDTNLASFCGRLLDGGESVVAYMGLGVGLDVSADGPYFFNALGLISQDQADTGADGRFCYFNVPPGPATVSILNAEATVSAFPFALFDGHHREHDFYLDQGIVATARLGVVATAHNQLGTEPAEADTYQSFEYVDLIPLGQDEPMALVGSGLVQTTDPVVSANSRIWAYAQGAEFEPAIYPFDGSDAPFVTGLLPRGFVEDMAIYSQTAFDPNLGTVVVEFHDLQDQGEGSLDLRLVDFRGEAVGEGWYYADRPFTKAIFFNVPPGYYTIFAETADSYWLAADTLFVYNETVTFMRLGSPMRYQPTSE